MRKMLTTFTLLCCSLSLIGCSSMSKQDVGVLTGGAAGALLGSTIGQGNGRIIATAAGALAGAFIGGAIGRNMDETDKLKMNNALNNNAVGQPAYWTNTNSGANYQVVPTKNVAIGDNPYCREYRTVANIAGRRQQMYGTACRQPDGSWQAMNQS